MVKPVPSRKDDVSATSPELPSLDTLNFESDFSAFMRTKVDEGVRRAALKKLFSDPRFNVMDGLDVYIDDYSKEDPIPPGMLAELQHAKTTLFGPRTEEKTEAEDNTPEDTQTSAGTPPLPASSNEPPPEPLRSDLCFQTGQ